jgi:hypothetical protein
MKLTGSRQEEKEYLLLLRRMKVITSAEYKQKVAVLERREARVQETLRKREEKREARLIQAAAAREAKRQMKEKQREAERKAKKQVQNQLIRRIVAGDPEMTVYDIYKSLSGSARVLVNNEDKLITSGVNYKVFRTYFLTSNGSDAPFIFEEGDVVLIVKPSTIQANRLIQAYRDGITHCVFTPILDKLSERLEGAAASTAKRIKQRISKLHDLKTLYEHGVPEDKMEEVAKAAGMKIQLFDVLGNSLNVYNEKGREGSIHLTNTRENHVDIGLVVDSDPVQMSAAEMKELWAELKEQGEFFMIDGDLREGQPTRIRTLKSAFQLKDERQELCKEFDKQLGILNYKINATKQPQLNEFLKAGRIVNGWSCQLGSGTATGCADMPMAYSQFKRCSEYAGFLGHIHQFRTGSFDMAFVESHLGYYGGTVLACENPFFQKLGLKVGTYLVLFGPELLYYMKNGVQFHLTQGAWGSRFDFEFPEEMLANRNYCYWAGRLGMERHETSHTLHATREWAEHLASEHSVFFWEQERLVTIKKPVKNCFTGHHILGAITSYIRIQMVEAMKCFDPSQLVRVVLDGIYYTGSKPAELNWFKDKPVKHVDSESLLSNLPWYSECETPSFPPMSRILRNSLLTGQGGSGKTWSVFQDPGFNTVLYVSPSHLLGQDVMEKYNAKYTTIHKLIGIDCQPYYEEFRIPPVIFVDEITQVDASWIEQVFEMYPESLVLLAGDIDAEGRWYQCRSGSGAEWNTIWKPRDVDVIEFLEDRRSRDDELKSLKLKIRSVMKKCDSNAELTMRSWAMKHLPLSTLDFQKGDTCIAGTHNTNKKLLEMGIVSGWYKKGGFVSFEEKEGYEKRGSFTIHAYQGKTVESGKIWIVLHDMFEYAMLYTAVSRAVNYDQLRFVWKV